MDVKDAVLRRRSVRAFRPDPVPGSVVRKILEVAAFAPSGGNLQPWRVYALAGEPLDALKRRVGEATGEMQNFDIYPPDLWDPFRTRRYENAEDLYSSISIARGDKPARLQQLRKNGELFGAPAGLFFFIDRGLGLPQWADLGMFMQTVMLLATEHGLDTCAQEYWSQFPRTVSEHVGAPDDHILFAGMALGWRDDSHPINSMQRRRDPFDTWASLSGFS